jgi:periplasmic copper chaperone A
MKSIYLVAVCVATSVIAGAGSVSAQGPGIKKEMHGHPATAATIRVEDAWARATPGLARNGGAYFTAMNAGKDADRITGGFSEISARTEMHTHLSDNGVMRMRQVDGIDVPAGGKVTFEPGGYHIMFIGLHKPFKKGDSFPVTLTFEKAGKQTVNVKVMGVGAMMGSEKAPMMKHDMKPSQHEMKPALGGHRGK